MGNSGGSKGVPSCGKEFLLWNFRFISSKPDIHKYIQTSLWIEIWNLKLTSIDNWIFYSICHENTLIRDLIEITSKEYNSIASSLSSHMTIHLYDNGDNGICGEINFKTNRWKMFWLEVLKRELQNLGSNSAIYSCISIGYYEECYLYDVVGGRLNRIWKSAVNIETNRIIL